MQWVEARDFRKPSPSPPIKLLRRENYKLYCKLLSKICSAVLHPNPNVASRGWQIYFIHGKYVFTKSTQSRKAILTNLLQGKAPTPTPTPPQRHHTNSRTWIQRVEQHMSDHRPHQAFQAVAEDGTSLGTNEEAFVAMQHLHPPRDNGVQLPPAAPQDTYDTPRDHIWNASLDDVQRAVKSFHVKTAAGPSGIPPGILRRIIQDESEEHLSNKLVRVLNLILNGTIPDIAAEGLRDARLIALTKKQGGYRPIAIGNTLRRLAARIATSQLKRSIQAYLEPVQFGVGTTDGTTTLAQLVDLDSYTPGNWVLQLDGKNAFNSISRTHVLSEATRRFPKLRGLLQVLYGDDPQLHLRTQGGFRTLTSSNGVQQGCPLSPALFAIGMHPALLKATRGEAKCRAYLDDVMVTGTRQACTIAWQELKMDLSMVGIQLQAHKCKVWSRMEAPPEPYMWEDIAQVCKDGLDILGIPVGTVAYRKQAIRRKLQAMEDTYLPKLRQLSKQSMYLLSRDVMFPKFVHLIRSTYGDPTQELDQIPATIKTILGDLLAHEASPGLIDRAGLPIPLGGLRLRNLAALQAFYYIGTWINTSKFVNRELLQEANLSPPLTSLKAHLQSMCSSSPEGIIAKGAPYDNLREGLTNLMGYCHEFKIKKVARKAIKEWEQVHPQAERGPRGSIKGAFLTAYPTNHVFNMNDPTFELAARGHLGLVHFHYPPTNLQPMQDQVEAYIADARLLPTPSTSPAQINIQGMETTSVVHIKWHPQQDQTNNARNPHHFTVAFTAEGNIKTESTRFFKHLAQHAADQGNGFRGFTTFWRTMLSCTAQKLLRQAYVETLDSAISHLLGSNGSPTHMGFSHDTAPSIEDMR